MSWKGYIWDRKIMIAVYMGCIGIASVLFSLDKLRYAEQADPGLLYYFIELALLLLIVGLAIDYMRQRAYYKQLEDTLQKAGDARCFHAYKVRNFGGAEGSTAAAWSAIQCLYDGA
ncbi:hypothetical protein [Paenibacillus gorillae]|uniref:hypothetical protein n=1 Tax=Paenibacillus gorillae TaxID=1243662 RepID=UPI0004BA2422|nr:hypothetical protein [Paenibacillus gorillae]